MRIRHRELLGPYLKLGAGYPGMQVKIGQARNLRLVQFTTYSSYSN
jgi:hypothetical protein